MSKAVRGARFMDPREPASPHAPPSRAIEGSQQLAGHSRGARPAATRAWTDVPDLPDRPVPPMQRFGLAGLEAVAGALALVASWVIWSSAGRTMPAMQALAGFAAIAGAALLVAAVARALRRNHASTGTTRIDGRAGVGVRSWAGEYWLEVVIDTSLTLLCVAVVIADLAGGGHWLPWSLLALVPAIWFGGLSVLAFTGRRNPEALWVIDDVIVHESLWGRERAPLAGCRSVASSGSSVVMTFVEPIRRRLCPRPWRPPVPPACQVRVDCRQLGHAADDVLTWLETVTATRL